MIEAVPKVEFWRQPLNLMAIEIAPYSSCFSSFASKQGKHKRLPASSTTPPINPS
jgi:hypothetical protein